MAEIQLEELPEQEVLEDAPPKPEATGGPAADWRHRAVYDRVLRVIYALPARFQTKLNIAGVSAIDLFTLNTPLGAAIEVNVVAALNDLRQIWDPHNEYSDYSFVRHAQAFPDVRLESADPGSAMPIIFGIELKGWFLLGKEGEPSFRYKITPAACADADLLVVFPWILDEVTSGTPKLLKPFVAEAKHAAFHRNYYWTYGRKERGKGVANKEVVLSPHAEPYPVKADAANDRAASDSGSNFGRVARGAFMSDFVADLLVQPIGGIPAEYWQKFLQIFAEGADRPAIVRRIAAIRRQVHETEWAKTSPEEVEALLSAAENVVAKLT